MTTSNVNQPDNTTSEESRGNQRRTDEEWIDAVFDVLSDARRRRVIRTLRARDGDATSVPALAESLAVREPNESDPDCLVVSLRHVHLPKLEATGVVEYTDERSRVRYTDSPMVEHLLEQI